MKSLTQYITENNDWDKCVAHIRKWKDLYDVFKEWEKFSIEEQLEILAESGFVGFILKEEIDNGCIMTLITATDRNDICGYIDDELSNRVDGNDVEDSNHYIVKYKGQKEPLYTHDEFEGKRKLPRTNIEWICCNPGEVAELCYYANDRAKQEMIKYMDLLEFSKREIKRIEQGYHDWI